MLVAADKVAYQYIDIEKRQVIHFKSRRELEEHIGSLSEDDYQRYLEQATVKIIADEAPVKFGVTITTKNNLYLREDKRTSYEEGFNDTISGKKQPNFPNKSVAGAYKRGAYDARKSL